MKFISQVSAALVTLGLLTAATAQDAVKFTVPGVSQPAATPAAPATPSTAPAATAAPVAAKKFTDAQIAEAYGWYTGAQMGLRQLKFTKAEIDAMARGMAGAAAGAQPNFDPKEIGPEVQAFLAKKNDTFMNELRLQNLADNAAFFTKLKENKAVTELPSGLRFEVLKPATGALPKPGQIATIHYTGLLISGQPFDSSIERGQPVELPLVAATAANPNGIIPGMYEGLLKVGVGGKARLYIPPSLAYGDEGSQAIPPGATLIFEVEVISVKDAPAAPATK